MTPFRERQDLLEMPSGRLLGSTPFTVQGVSPGARRLVGIDDKGTLQIYNHAGKLLVVQPAESIDISNMPFSPDLDGRYLLWGHRYGLVSVTDLVEVQRRLRELGLGW